jgi:hypothetical protein
VEPPSERVWASLVGPQFEFLLEKVSRGMMMMMMIMMVMIMMLIMMWESLQRLRTFYMQHQVIRC